MVVGVAEVGVAREDTEGEHNGPLTVNILAAMVDMVVATAHMGVMAMPLLHLPPTGVDLMDHLDMTKEVRNNIGDAR